jgi:uncharacterized protein YqjF (DUF2071 family)
MRPTSSNAAGAPRPFLTAAWRYLAMLNYEVDPALLRPLVPAGTELDAWEGLTLASVVGFRFLDTRVLGAPIPFHRDFDEVNLRFYVRRRADEGAWRRGVVFVKEIVPRLAIAAVARACYNEPYVALPMRHRLDMSGAAEGRTGSVAYEWRYAGHWHGLAVETDGAAFPIEPGSEEEFVTEHYWGYTAQRDGGCKEYQVEHPRWNVWRAAAARLDCDVASVYGPGFAAFLAGRPRSAFVADGSAVTVYAGVRIEEQGKTTNAHE